MNGTTTSKLRTIIALCCEKNTRCARQNAAARTITGLRSNSSATTPTNANPTKAKEIDQKWEKPGAKSRSTSGRSVECLAARCIHTSQWYRFLAVLGVDRKSEMGPALHLASSKRT